MCTRQPCHHIQSILDVGPWLCVPPFRMVCPFREKTYVSLLSTNAKGIPAFSSPENACKDSRLEH